MENAWLFVVLGLVYLMGQVHLLRTDLFFAAAYFYLFVYGIFAIIGYTYFPDLSRSVSSYFGEEIVRPVLLFMIFSFLSVYLALLAVAPLRGLGREWLIAGSVRFSYPVATTYVMSLLLVAQIWGVLFYWDDLNYSNANDLDFIQGQGLAYQVWFGLFKTSPAFVVVSYSVLRYRLWTGAFERGLLIALLAIQFTLLVLIASRVGNRTDLVAILNGFVFTEIIASKRQGARIGSVFSRLVLMTSAGLGIMVWITLIRGTVSTGRVLDAFLLQDYFAPAHILFGAVAYQVVNLEEVITSNTMNALIMLGHPYLQEYVANVFNPGVSSRISGYAFYFLSEGYIAFGKLGFVYNGAVFALGLLLWRRLAASSSSMLNALILPVLALDLANICRGQSAYFIKYLYFHLLPGLALIFIMSGLYVRAIRATSVASAK